MPSKPASKALASVSKTIKPSSGVYSCIIGAGKASSAPPLGPALSDVILFFYFGSFKPNFSKPNHSYMFKVNSKSSVYLN